MPYGCNTLLSISKINPDKPFTIADEVNVKVDNVEINKYFGSNEYPQLVKYNLSKMKLGAYSDKDDDDDEKEELKKRMK